METVQVKRIKSAKMDAREGTQRYSYKLTLRGNEALVRKTLDGRWALHVSGPRGPKSFTAHNLLRDAVKAFEVHVAGASVLNLSPTEQATKQASDSRATARAMYAKIRARMLHESSGITKEWFDTRVRQSLKNAGDDLESAWQWVSMAKRLHIPCGRCASTGRFVTMVENGKPKGPGGICFRCQGRGYQTYADAKRNWGYDVNRAVDVG